MPLSEDAEGLLLENTVDLPSAVELDAGISVKSTEHSISLIIAVMRSTQSLFLIAMNSAMYTSELIVMYSYQN